MNAAQTKSLLPLMALAVLALQSTETQAQRYQVPWHTVDVGGMQSGSSAHYELYGTTGQYDACDASGTGQYRITGGYWGYLNTPPVAVLSDPTGVDKTRFISFIPGNAGQQTALMVTLNSLHHVVPPYSGGTAKDFSAWEGQVRWVGPPAQYRESTASGVLFWASKLQCEPYYADWSTIGLLHVTGAEIIPSSQYDVQALSNACQGAETDCADMSTPLPIRSTRWGEVEIPYNPPSSTTQPDFADVAALVDKFRSASGAPIKARALLSGQVPEMSLDLSFIHISDCVDAFRGRPYPYSGPCACPSTITCNAVACSTPAPCPAGQLCVAGFCRDACERCTP